MSTATVTAPPAEKTAEQPVEQPAETNGVRPRIRGIDLARGLALLGMFAVHGGPSSDVGGVTGALMFVASGHSSILFATLAGLSLALLSGGATPPGASDPRRTRLRIAVRGLLIMAIGVTLTAMGTPVAVILAYYGVFFLLAIPFLRLTARTLLVIAGCWALAGPVVALLVQSWWWGSSAADMVARVDPITLLSGEGIDQLLVTGVYPAVTWMPFILVGLALGRLDIARLSRTTMLAIGIGMAFVAYGFSALLTPLGPRPVAGPPDASGSLDWSILLGADAHTGSTFEIVGGIGVALAILALCLAVAERLPRLTRPIVAAGSMSLTIYVLHVLTINVAGLDAMPGQPLWVLLAFIAGSIAFALIWFRFARRGPLESFVHSTTAALVTRKSSLTTDPTTDRRTHP
ncbi:Uncharacterized membrane protein YeiB [Agreia bicolorata]|uniref:Uncharacterized membrane protein YeiB n=1 Tax=Agreia bicolorata TaxID=110935 RepID=A0A1T4WSP4_9MICO|nr:DUF418 domain-containing protein [Agreia bicolorata]SKA80344.1 Uncharacterized membrane protein YeiB [Agreia bicolorata]